MSIGAEAAETPADPKGRLGAQVLRDRDFRLFWTGALISNLGTWMQAATVPYVLYQLTGSGAWVGLAAFSALFPGFLLGPIAGSLADRFPRRTVLLVIQVISGALALALWGVWEAGVHSPTVIVALTAGGGAMMGLSMPSWQGFISELVPREHLMGAISLNSAQFNLSRAVGPALGGIVLAAWGPSWAFLVNALSYGAVVASLLAVRVTSPSRASRQGSMLGHFTDALHHVRATRGLRVELVFLAAVSLLGLPVPQLATLFARQAYDVGPGAYGVLTGAFGLGGMAAAVGLSAATVRRRSALASRSMLLLSAALFMLGIAPWYVAGVAAMFLVGVSALLSTNALLTSLQMLVEEEFRGRALAVHVMTFAAALPIGALCQALLADALGPRVTVFAAGAVLLSLTMWWRARRTFDALDGL